MPLTSVPVNLIGDARLESTLKMFNAKGCFLSEALTAMQAVNLELLQAVNLESLFTKIE